MKLFKYGLPLAALAVMASCSNDNIDAPAANQGGEELGGLYATININLPSVPADRTSFDVYDEGDPSEYDVNNLWLYLWRAENSGSETTEADATTFQGAYQMGITELGNADTNQDGVTLTHKVTFQITDLEADVFAANDFYGLVVVNKPSDLANPTAGFDTWNQTTLSAAVRAQEAIITASTIGERVNAFLPVYDSKTYFTMTNAPLINNTKDKIQTLVKLDKDKFATSPAAATQSAGTFYVQRGVAKVEVATGTGVTDLEEIPVVGSEAKFKLEGWALDQTASAGYLVQVVEGTSAFATGGTEAADWSGTWFVNGPIETGVDLNRIMFAKANAYAADTNTALLAYTEARDNNNIWNDPDKAEYALENTMDYNKMIKNRTTRAIFKGVYLIDGSGDGEDFVMYEGTDKAYSVKDKVNSDLDGKKSEDGKYKISDLIKEANVAEVVSALGAASANEEVYYYPGGVTYYTALIRHFDDTEAGAADLSISNVNDYTKAHTGRYGIVRNNSYQLKVKGVQGFGKPDVPTTPPDPDDKPDPIKYNVNLEIKIMDWAKRGYEYLPK